MSNLLNKIILAVIESAVLVGFLTVFNRISDGDDFKFEFVPDAVVPFVLCLIVTTVFDIVGNFFNKKRDKQAKNK